MYVSFLAHLCVQLLPAARGQFDGLQTDSDPAALPHQREGQQLQLFQHTRGQAGAEEEEEEGIGDKNTAGKREGGEEAE